jgi:hypothetical protein
MANRKYQEYDLPASLVDMEEINIGDIRVMPNQSHWIVENMTAHGAMYRLRVVPDTPENRKRIWKMEQM